MEKRAKECMYVVAIRGIITLKVQVLFSLLTYGFVIFYKKAKCVNFISSGAFLAKEEDTKAYAYSTEKLSAAQKRRHNCGSKIRN